MAFIPTIGAVRTDMQFTLAGQQVHNILWFSRNANWTQSEREALNTALAAWWSGGGNVGHVDDMSLTQITTVNQEAANAPSSTLIVSPPVAGTNSSAPLPNNAAACATLRTDLRGRSYRGRVYLSGIPGTYQQDPITFTTAFLTQMLSTLAALKTAIEALGAVWVVVSHWSNKAPRTAGLKTPITAVAMDQYIDSQRRRLGLRGV